MTINVSAEPNVFHLQTDHTSYIFQIMENGDLGQVYYGALIHSKDSYQNLSQREIHDATPAVSEELNDLQPELVKKEYAGFGKGDFRYPAFQLIQGNGSRVSEFKYQSYKIVDGKERLTDLPASFDDQADDVQTLMVTLKDSLTGMLLVLNYTVFPHQDVIVRSSKFINESSQDIKINCAYSAQIDLPDADYDLIQFSGDWARERHLYRNHLRPGSQGVSSLRTASSHQQNPFIMLARPQANEDHGDAFGFNLIYSGNFKDSIEVDQFEVSRVLIGINPDEFSWKVTAGNSFQTPEAVMSFTDQGFNRLSQQLGDFYDQHLTNQNFVKKDRPILINNWEATYFDFNETKLMTIVDQAKKLGIEMFVLDDGWFGKRNDDTTSLGDWDVDLNKFPDGLGHFSQRVHDEGLKFGLWFEPEMISVKSSLYQEHPDWLLGDKNAQLTPSRHQFVLDMSRQDVVDYLFNKISRIIQNTKLDYIKWDMNRNITESFSDSLPADQQLELSHRYILGVYDLYARLTETYPDVLFESCASGGGRFDLGMMYYAPQAWTSDDTDAVERLKIQYGTSYGYPQSMMGAHVSAVPNDQNGRVTSLQTRGNVAFYGDLGYELDITQMTAQELEQVKEQVAFYKQYRHLFQYGKFYRIDDPFGGDGNITSWQVTSDDQKQAIAARYQLLNHPNAPYQRQYFKGLDPKQLYTVNSGSEKFYGDELMHAGYFVATPESETGYSKDFSSQLFIVSAV
ncbi:alpha-galactosidase [Companilactobacillus versmoldensis]|uniref:Alpha-galactosidase n=1 Tax=Companilactobacillus versmoldensis DSM 14857 = KCTC 3814 TaxID=1423815 RepID=A0A0R1SLH5_9LACO|nr:alpha-galactosidase [Companilactobacillus versmoldensis]KRL65771.1 alpha-galactosidase [Companilactobacillus versmoldensis DSM 14857 = KCTC 3814]